MNAGFDAFARDNVGDLAVRIGLQGGWYSLRMFWNDETKKYDRAEGTKDGITYAPWTKELEESNNVISIRYIGGPDDGKFEC